MLIYSHLTPQKLIPIAKSRQYLIDHTDVCGLVDDPDFAVDIDTALNYNQAIKGKPTAITKFLDGFILSGHALDAATINFYVRTVRNNPIFYPYLRDLNTNFKNKYSIVADCLNSPCNYFAPISPNIGTLGDVAARLNYNTQPTIPVSGIPAGFAMGMASLTKIPLSIQSSAGQLTCLTSGIFKSVMGIFSETPAASAAQLAAIEGGNSYRATSIGDVYTSDYMTYYDTSTAAADILGNIAGGMGDCFRLYQHQARYNPFDYGMNQQMATKSGSLTRVEKVYTSMGYNGVNLNNMGDYTRSGNNAALSPSPTPSTDTQMQSTINGTSIKLAVTVFGGYYDTSNKVLYRDGSDMYNSPQGAEYFQNTQGGIGHRGKTYVFVPSTEAALVRQVKAGYTYNTDLEKPTAGKFNRGFATDKQTVYNYFALAGPQVDKSAINTAIATGTLLARIKFNGKTFTIPVIDTKGPSTNTIGGTSYRVIDITADCLVDLYGLSLATTSEQVGKIDTEICTKILNYSTFKGAANNIADVQFIIKGVFEPAATASTEINKPTNVSGYSNGKLPDSALTSIGSGHKLWGNAATKYLEMVAAARADGISWGITDSYRTYEAQVDVARRKGLYSEGGLAARPGTSNHGLGKAVDLELSTAAFTWLQSNAVRFQYYTIPRERWHWEYRGS